MPSTFRIPKAEIRGFYGKALAAYARRTYGQVPDNAYVFWHHRPVLKAVLSFEAKVAKLDRLDAEPEVVRPARQRRDVIGCSWCLDFGYFLAHNDGLDLAKVREVPRWRDSDVFTPLERDVLAYAEAMSTTPLTVTDEMVAAPVGEPGHGGRRRAHPDGRAGEHALALQLRGGPAEPGLLRRVRAAARRTPRSA